MLLVVKIHVGEGGGDARTIKVDTKNRELSTCEGVPASAASVAYKGGYRVGPLLPAPAHRQSCRHAASACWYTGTILTAQPSKICLVMALSGIELSGSPGQAKC